MTLILFDVDGTLTSTSNFDADCFARAYEEVFGDSIFSTDWSEYDHVTDTGILSQALMRQRGSGYTEEEFATFERTFIDCMESAFCARGDGVKTAASDAEAFGEIPGARSLIATLTEEAGHPPFSLATGCLRSSAMFKLRKVGIDASDFSGGFADDDPTRGGIALAAIESARSRHDLPSEGLDVVYIGDGVWDARTSRALGMRFVGVSRDTCAEALREEGANVVLHDLSDPAAFFGAIREARVPAL